MRRGYIAVNALEVVDRNATDAVLASADGTGGIQLYRIVFLVSGIPSRRQSEIYSFKKYVKKDSNNNDSNTFQGIEGISGQPNKSIRIDIVERENKKLFKKWKDFNNETDSVAETIGAHSHRKKPVERENDTDDFLSSSRSYVVSLKTIGKAKNNLVDLAAAYRNGMIRVYSLDLS